ncbi:PTS IIA-like nitrogen regulatory protein PtsN [Methylocella silvestris]|uniref:PTS IIA-like nitrogen-regulatory protein PtsN n=1 Tax=Methylocella silvestris TaxID=199596 RepID=A0A2J7TKG1_METSI|nr:PTS IIA-like nitrogen regulatory protein PtsN [Methylocella silvestris]PNG27260.1 PTS IIA-like nitrogen-regulatory protein PtsN [Methylocella silvestris]
MLTNLISPEAIIPALKATGKKQALQELSERAAELGGISAREIYDALLQRERLGSTGAGDGIAIPHAKLAKATGMLVIFARASRPIDFEAIDGAPVDLIFLLIAPESAGADHLKALARLARMLREPAITAKLRAARDVNALYSVLTEDAASHAA